MRLSRESYHKNFDNKYYGTYKKDHFIKTTRDNIGSPRTIKSILKNPSERKDSYSFKNHLKPSENDDTFDLNRPMAQK
jgi:hypothetical protein